MPTPPQAHSGLLYILLSLTATLVPQVPGLQLLKAPDPPGVPKTRGPILLSSQGSIFEFIVQSYALNVGR